MSRGGEVKACGTCSEARGIKGLPLIEGGEISTLSQLCAWTVAADKVLTF
ncbi:DsrE family protein [Longilinea arvoryzae]